MASVYTVKKVMYTYRKVWLLGACAYKTWTNGIYKLVLLVEHNYALNKQVYY